MNLSPPKSIQLIAILLIAIALTRFGFMFPIEKFTSNWRGSYTDEFQRMVYLEALNIQMDAGKKGKVDEKGCFYYNRETSDSIQYCLFLNSDGLYVKKRQNDKDANDLKIVHTHLNWISGIRTVQTSNTEVESNLLKLGAELTNFDRQFSSSDPKEEANTGIRWLQAVMKVVRKMNRTNQMLNGAIQWLIYFFSSITILLLFLEYNTLLRSRQEIKDPGIQNLLENNETKISKEQLDNLLKQLKSRKEEALENEVLEPLIINEFLEPSIEFIANSENIPQRGELVTVLNATGAVSQDKLERRFNILRYFITAIPSLGFIGTIIGISKALGQTSTLTGESLAYERILANESLGQSLFIAFDTTLIALAISLALTFLVDWQESRQLEFVSNFRKNLIRTLAHANKFS